MRQRVAHEGHVNIRSVYRHNDCNGIAEESDEMGYSELYGGSRGLRDLKAAS